MVAPRPDPSTPATFYTAVTALCTIVDSLQSQLDDAQSALTAETLARQTTDIAIATLRDQKDNAEIAARQAADVDEAEARIAGDNGLQNSIIEVRDAAFRFTSDQIRDVANQLAAVNRDLLAVRDYLIGQISDAETGISNSVNSRIDQEIAQRASEVAIAMVGSLSGARPGVSPTAFSHAAVGALAKLDTLDPSGAISTPFGPAYRLDGAALIAARAGIPVDPDAIWILKVRYWRAVDVTDPNNAAVDIGIQWLDADDADLGRTLLRRDMSLSVSSGPRTLTRRVFSLENETPAIQPPRGAVSWRPYLRTYESDGSTAVGTLGSFDATFSGVYAPDVYDLSARIDTVEGQVKAGFADNALDRRVLALPGDPTPSDIAPGTIRAVKNLATGRQSIWSNDGGTMVDYGLLQTS